jgi:hypothetical protein
MPKRILALLAFLAVALPLTVMVADAASSSGSGAVKFGSSECE